MTQFDLLIPCQTTVDRRRGRGLDPRPGSLNQDKVAGKDLQGSQFFGQEGTTSGIAMRLAQTSDATGVDPRSPDTRGGGPRRSSGATHWVRRRLSERESSKANRLLR